MADATIRSATVDDADALAAVYHDAYRENRRLGFPMKAETVAPSTVTAWIRDHAVFVAVSEGAVVGGVRLATIGPDRSKLSRLAVATDHQGAGVGSRLLDRAEDAARERGHSAIQLTTPPAHPYLPDFYRRRGYEVTGPHPLDDREYDEVLMEKSLA